MRVAVIDDDQYSRDVAAEWIQNLGDEAVIFEKSIGESQDWVAAIESERCDAALVDYRLSAKGYAAFSGAELASKLGKRAIGSILLTTYRREGIVDYIAFGRHIGYVLHKDDLDEEHYPVAIKQAMKLAKGEISLEQEAFRTLVRVDSIGDGNAFLIVPALNYGAGVCMPIKFLKAQLGRNVCEGDRFLADVNIAASDGESVFIDSPSDLPTMSKDYAKLLRS